MKLFVGSLLVIASFLIQSAFSSIYFCSCHCPVSHRGYTFHIDECSKCHSECESTYPNCGGKGVKSYCWSTAAAEEDPRTQQKVGCDGGGFQPGCHENEPSREEAPTTPNLRADPKRTGSGAVNPYEERTKSSDNHPCCCLCEATGKEKCTKVNVCDDCQRTCDNEVFQGCSSKVFAGCA